MSPHGRLLTVIGAPTAVWTPSSKAVEAASLPSRSTRAPCLTHQRAHAALTGLTHGTKRQRLSGRAPRGDHRDGVVGVVSRYVCPVDGQKAADFLSDTGEDDVRLGGGRDLRRHPSQRSLFVGNSRSAWRASALATAVASRSVNCAVRSSLPAGNRSGSVDTMTRTPQRRPSTVIGAPTPVLRRNSRRTPPSSLADPRIAPCERDVACERPARRYRCPRP